LKYKNLAWKIPLPVLAVAISKPWAISCEIKCLQTNSLIVQSSGTKIKFYKQKAIAGTGSGCEQALGHKLSAHMLTIKFFDSSKES
jgi:hypothetical protein